MCTGARTCVCVSHEGSMREGGASLSREERGTRHAGGQSKGVSG